MADNVIANAGSGGATFATDDVAGVHYPIGKQAWGALDTVNLVDDATGKRVPVKIGESLPAGVNNIGDVDVLTLPALPAGTNNIGDVDVLTLPGSLTGKAEDSIAADLDVGLPILGVRNDAAAVKTSLDGDYGMLALDSAGRVGITDLGGTISIDDGAGSITIDGSVSITGALPAGTNNIGDIDVLTLPGSLAGQAEDAAHVSGDVGLMALVVRKDTAGALAGTDGDYSPLQVDASGNLRVNIAVGGGSGGTSSIDEATYTPATSVGTPIMGAVDETAPDAAPEGTLALIRSTLNRALHVNLRDASGNEVSVGGGTQYDEDTVATAAEKITMAGVVRKDTAASLVDLDGDRTELIVDASGRLHVNVGTSALPTGAATLAEQQTQTTSLQLLDDTVATDGSATPTKGILIAGQDGTNAQTIKTDTSGELQVDVLTLPALAAGSNKIGSVDLDSDATPASAVPATAQYVAGTDGTNARGLKTDASGELQVDVLTLPALPAGTNNIGDVDVLTLPDATVVGKAAHDAAIAGNPVRTGGRARSSDYTAVVSDDTADFVTDLHGKQVVLPYSIPENFTDGATAAITGTTDTAVIAAPGAGVRLYITSILVTNSHATVGTVVELKDGTTVRYRGFAAAAGGGFSCTFPTPIRLTANTAFNAANVTTGSNTYVSATGYKAL